MDSLSLSIVLSYLDAEQRATLALVSPPFAAAVRGTIERGRLSARALVVERTIGAPKAAPAIGAGMLDSQRVCVVHRTQKMWYEAESGTMITSDGLRGLYPMYVRAVGDQCMLVMFNSGNGEAVVSDAATGATLQRFRLRELSGLCWPIALSPCGTMLAFPFGNSVVNVGDVPTGTYSSLPATPDFRPRGAGFNGRRALVAGHIVPSRRMRINLYDVDSHSLIMSMDIRGHTTTTRRGFVEFSPSGGLALVPTSTSVIVVNLAQKRVVHDLRARTKCSGEITRSMPYDHQFAAFSADGAWIVTTRERRGCLQIWDTPTGELLCSIDGAHHWARPLSTGLGIITCSRDASGWQTALLRLTRQGGVKRKAGEC